MRRYSRADLRNRMERAGFLVHRLTYTNSTLFPALAIARLIQRRRGLRSEQEAGAEISVPPGPVNAIMTMVMRLEGLWLRASAVRCSVWLGSRPARDPDFRLEDPQSQVTTVGAPPPASVGW